MVEVVVALEDAVVTNDPLGSLVDVGGENGRRCGAVVVGRERIAEFIDAARDTLWLQNERYQDTVIVERLVRALRRGVKVHIMARPPHNLKKNKLIEGVGGLRIMQDVGAKVHRLRHMKLHGKMLLADEKNAILGSINLAPGSFDARRELAIETVPSDDLRSYHVNSDKITRVLEAPLTLSDGSEMQITASIGIAFFPEDSTTGDGLVSWRDGAFRSFTVDDGLFDNLRLDEITTLARTDPRGHGGHDAGADASRLARSDREDR